MSLEWIGVVAATLTMFSFVPQIVRAVRLKSVKDVSVVMVTQLALGVALWIVYGVYRRDPIIITANIVSLSTLLILLYLYFHYDRIS